MYCQLVAGASDLPVFANKCEGLGGRFGINGMEISPGGNLAVARQELVQLYLSKLPKAYDVQEPKFKVVLKFRKLTNYGTRHLNKQTIYVIM
eukprot:1159970-Pelagomonas_calceolata.AAC.5